MTKLFNISDFKHNIPKDGMPHVCNQQPEQDIAVIKFEAMHMLKLESLKHLTRSLPAPGEIYFLWTLKSFNVFTFITYVIKEKECIDHLLFSTYSINTRIVNSLIKWYDKGYIKQITILISDSIRFRLPKLNDLLQAQASTRNIRINYAWNHSKITLMRVADNYYVAEGSGNFSENAMHEQYIFYNNQTAYEFRQRNIQDTIDRGTV